MTNQPVSVYIGLGSNQQQPLQQIRQAVEHLQSVPAFDWVVSSSLYRSVPWGLVAQPDYINSVVEIKTHLSPLQVLHQLQKIEHQQGRNRQQERHWGPRCIDLDLLLYGEQQIDCEELIVPHAQMLQREFVLYPLYEIAPDLYFPDGRSLVSLLDGVRQKGLERISAQLPA